MIRIFFAKVLYYLFCNRTFFLSIFIPLIFLPIIYLYDTLAGKCAYVIMVTVTFLITQTLPLAIASLLPLLLFPICGVMSLKDDPITLFLSSLIIAQAIEIVDLHKRLALNILYISGSKPVWLLLGFLATTFFVSMWINNTATAALLTPIACGVIQEFRNIYAVIDPLIVEKVNRKNGGGETDDTLPDGKLTSLKVGINGKARNNSPTTNTTMRHANKVKDVVDEGIKLPFKSPSEVFKNGFSKFTFVGENTIGTAPLVINDYQIEPSAAIEKMNGNIMPSRSSSNSLSPNRLTSGSLNKTDLYKISNNNNFHQNNGSRPNIHQAASPLMQSHNTQRIPSIIGERKNSDNNSIQSSIPHKIPSILNLVPATPDSNRHYKNPVDEAIAPIRKALFIAVAFGANLGGTATLTGSAPNMIMVGLMAQLFGRQAVIGFDTWLFFSLPGALVILFLLWICLSFYFIGIRETCKEFTTRSEKGVFDARPYIRSQLNHLGQLKEQEIIVLVTFFILVLLWIFKNPKFMPGWESWFVPGYVNDTTPAILFALLYFALPTSFSSLFTWPTTLEVSKGRTRFPGYTPILTWSKVQNQMMWDVLLLFGGGMAVASGFKSSGLSKDLLSTFRFLKRFSPPVICLVFTLITSFLTEILSNVSTAAILNPLMAEMAISMKINPYYFVFPVTLAASYSFMLPIATGPNAIVYTAGNLSFWDMVKPGLIINFIGVLVTFISINTLGPLILGTNTFPDWAAKFNSTQQSGS